MKKKPRYDVVALIVLLIILFAGLVVATTRAGGLTAARQAAGLNAMEPEAAAALDVELIGQALGLLSMLVPLSAVALAFITREVISSLFTGLVYGHLMLGAVGGFTAEAPGGPGGFLLATLEGAMTSVLDTVTDRDNASVVILCLVIGGLIALINATGAFQTLAARLIGRIRNPRRACLLAGLLGLSMFFDDYANTLIVGPVMRPITDQARVSRERLAYSLDSTAAPLASIAVVSSWVATEVAAIRAGLVIANVDVSAYSVFLASIPYSFYNVIALVFVFVSAMCGREYGPMLKAEIRARLGQPIKPGTRWTGPVESGDEPKGKPASIWVAIVPLLLLLVMAFAGFWWNGSQNALALGLVQPGAPLTISAIIASFGSADTAYVILMAAIVASVLALFLGRISKSFSFTQGLTAWQEGASGLLPTVLILVLAWALSDVTNQLGAVHYLVRIITQTVPYWVVPSLVFLTCCLISFGMGSYGTMAIAVPMVIPIAYGVIANAPAIGNPWQFVAACTACVLSGAVFGDHCSPITDTTILSSTSAGCDNIDHVKTQLPYALTVAAIATLSGTLLAGLGLPVWISYSIALGLVALVFALLGKSPDKLAAQRAKSGTTKPVSTKP